MYTKDGHKIIYKIRGGSYLYGLNTPLSDEDYIGIFLNKPDELLGLKNCEIIEDNTISKNTDGKNNSDAVDCKYYSLKKFCNLAINNNPTILEMFFANEDNILYCDNYGKKLISNYQLFISQKSKHSYLGYAFSQKQKSFVKSENLRILVEALDILKGYTPDELNKIMLYDILDSIPNTRDSYPDYITIGDLNFNNQRLKSIKNKIETRFLKASHRADGMLKHGLDYKFMSHTIRLLYEGIELLKSGKITFPLKQRDLILDIKQGRLSIPEIVKLIDDLEQECKTVGNNTILPYSANSKAINELITSINMDYLYYNRIYNAG